MTPPLTPMIRGFALCNEVLRHLSWPEQCELIVEMGYTGVELAPFTFAESVTDLDGAARREIARVATDAGLTITGLHWLLASPPGLRLTAMEIEQRQRTLRYLGDLARFCADVGGTVLTLGSPQQRRLAPDVSREHGVVNAHQCLRANLSVLEETGVILCLEALPPPEADFWTTLAEVEQMVELVGHSQVTLMLDAKSMAGDVAPPPDLIRRYGPRARHFHANDPNRRGPGQGELDFRPLVAVLREIGYSGWVSVEPFDYHPDPETCARESLRYLRAVFAEEMGK